MTSARLLWVVAIAAATGAPATGQSDRLLGLVRGVGGRPVADALVRAFPEQPSALPWLETPRAAPATCRTDARGGFSLAEGRRAALWIDAGDEGAFLADVAPGVPAIAEVAPIATVVLESGARGAWVRIDGVPVGFVSGAEIRVPASALELLVETETGAFVEARRVAAGERVQVVRPPRRAAILRGLQGGAIAVLPPWPERIFAAEDGGVIRLPASDRPLSLRVTTIDAGGASFDEVWLEPGEERVLAAESPAWRPIEVRDGAGRAVAGARVVTLRSGPGRPAIAAISETDVDGVGRYRHAERARVAVLAEPFALAAVWPGENEDVVQLQPSSLVKMRIVDDRGQPLARARVGTRIDPAIDQQLLTDGRGAVALRQLPPGPITVAVEHADHLPLEVEIRSPTTGVVELALDRGSEIHGVVTCSDRSRIEGVLVEVRDSAGVTGMRPRVAQTDAEGRFVLRGLPDCPLLLFARSTERGKTWSGTARDVTPGEQPVTIAIECDDPVPDARLRRGG